MTVSKGVDSRFHLPHEGVAQFVTRVMTHESGTICCEGRVPPGSPYGRTGHCPSFVLIELAAQAAAALESLEREHETEGGSSPGLLVRARRMQFKRREIVKGRAFRTVIRRTASAGPLLIYDMRVVDSAGDEVLSGELGIFIGAA